MSNDIGMSPTGHGEGPPLRHSNKGSVQFALRLIRPGFVGRSAGHCDGRSGDDHEGADDLVEAVGSVAPEDS